MKFNGNWSPNMGASLLIRGAMAIGLLASIGNTNIANASLTYTSSLAFAGSNAVQVQDHLHIFSPGVLDPYNAVEPKIQDTWEGWQEYSNATASSIARVYGPRPLLDSPSVYLGSGSIAESKVNAGDITAWAGAASVPQSQSSGSYEVTANGYFTGFLKVGAGISTSTNFASNPWTNTSDSYAEISVNDNTISLTAAYDSSAEPATITPDTSGFTGTIHNITLNPSARSATGFISFTVPVTVGDDIDIFTDGVSSLTLSISDGQRNATAVTTELAGGYWHPGITLPGDNGNDVIGGGVGGPDGDVDNFDLERILDGLGTTSGASLSDGDVTGDGAVTSADFMMWQRGFGATTTPAVVAGSVSVPEPNTVILSTLLVGLCLLSRPARRVASDRLA